uniref:Uncharacterized protein n=1 Tax=Cannabis sativa TaxID=3483 RepID=A0A803QDN5_CANSA
MSANEFCSLRTWRTFKKAGEVAIGNGCFPRVSTNTGFLSWIESLYLTTLRELVTVTASGLSFFAWLNACCTSLCLLSYALMEGGELKPEDATDRSSFGEPIFFACPALDGSSLEQNSTVGFVGGIFPTWHLWVSDRTGWVSDACHARVLHFEFPLSLVVGSFGQARLPWAKGVAQCSMSQNALVPLAKSILLSREDGFGSKNRWRL